MVNTQKMHIYCPVTAFITFFCLVSSIEINPCNRTACNYMFSTDTNKVPSDEITVEWWMYHSYHEDSHVALRGIFAYEGNQNIGGPLVLLAAAVAVEPSVDNDVDSLVIHAFGQKVVTLPGVPREKWCHAAIAWRSSVGIMLATIDEDVSMQVPNVGLGQLLSGGGLFVLGKQSKATPFIGSIEEFRIWSKYSNALRLHVLRTQPSTVDGTLWAHYRLHFNKSVDLFDRSIHLRHLSISGQFEHKGFRGIPRVYNTLDYRAPLGSGPASSPQFNVGAGSDAAIACISRGEEAMVELGIYTGGVISLAGGDISFKDGFATGSKIKSSGAIQVVGTGYPIVSWVPKTFAATDFVFPALRQNHLVITVLNIADEFTSEESNLLSRSAKAQYVALYAPNVTVNITIDADGCRKIDSASNSFIASDPPGQSTRYSILKAFDLDLLSYFYNTDPSRWYFFVDFQLPLTIQRYTLSNGRDGQGPSSWTWKSHDGTGYNTLIDQKSNIQWKLAMFAKKSFWVRNHEKLFQRLKFEATAATDKNENPINRLYIGEIEFFSCGSRQKNVEKGPNVPWRKNKTLAVGTRDILAIYLRRNQKRPGIYFVASSHSWTTSSLWKCTATRPDETTWAYFDFDDSSWPHAVEYGSNFDSDSNGVRRDAQLIWTANDGDDQEIWCRYNPSGQSLVSIYNSYDKKTTVGTIKRGESQTFDLPNNWYTALTLSSTDPVLIALKGSFYDSRPIPPASTELLGFATNWGKIVFARADTTMQVYNFQGITQKPYTGGVGHLQYVHYGISGSRSQYDCNAAIHLIANQPVGGATYADGDGNEATPFLPVDTLATEYVVPRTSEFVALLGFRPEDPNGEILVDVLSADNVLVTKLKLSRATGKENENQRPSCYRYLPTGVIKAGTKLVSNYPIMAVFEDYDSQDETILLGKGGYVWSALSRTVITVTEGGPHESYYFGFETLDQFNHTRGKPKDSVYVYLKSDGQIYIEPPVLVFTPEDWNLKRRINVSALPDGKIETYLSTSIISHRVTSPDPAFQGFHIEDVVVETINVDKSSVVDSVSLEKQTGGLLALLWNPPNDEVRYNYAVESFEANTKSFTPDFTQSKTLSCNSRGCVANGTFEFSTDKLRSAYISINVRPTDFDGDTEFVQWIKINGILVRQNCDPGKSLSGWCSQEDSFPCVSNFQVSSTLLTGSLLVSGKVTDTVDSSACPDKGVQLFTMDLQLRLVYQSSDEIYNNANTSVVINALKPATKYNFRITTIDSANNAYLSRSQIFQFKTLSPTPPSSPGAPWTIKRTGGSTTVAWKEPFDSGGGAIVRYKIAHIKSSSGANETYNFTDIFGAQTHFTFYKLSAFTSYVYFLLAQNEFFSCTGDGQISPKSAIYTTRPSLPTEPLNLVAVETSGGSVSLRWSSPMDLGGHTELWYDVLYKQSVSDHLNTWTEVIKAVKVQSASTISPSAKILGLRSSTSYDFKVRPRIVLEDDPYTLSNTGCKCIENDHVGIYRSDCACCRPGACQCNIYSPRKCVPCGESNVFETMCASPVDKVAITVGENSVYNLMTPSKHIDSGRTTNSTLEFWVAFTGIRTNSTIRLVRIKDDNSVESTITARFDSRVFECKIGSHMASIKMPIALSMVNRWTHFAFVKTGRNFCMFVDGETRDDDDNCGQTSTLIEHVYSSNSVFEACHLLSDVSIQGACLIDDIRLYSASKSIADVQAAIIDIGKTSSSLMYQNNFNGDLVSSCQLDRAIPCPNNFVGYNTVKRLTGYFSNIYSVSTSRPTRPGKILNVLPAATTGGSLKISWGVNFDEGVGLRSLLGFRVYISSTLAVTDFQHAHVADGKGNVLNSNRFYISATEGHVVRLKPNTTYAVCVTAINNVGEGDLSTPVEIKTSSLVSRPSRPYPPFLSREQVFNTTTNSSLSWNQLKIEWRPPADTGGVGLHDLTYILDMFDGHSWSNQSTSSLSLVIDMPKANHPYSFRLFAKNKVGLSELSHLFNVTSNGKCPPSYFGEQCNGYAFCDFPREHTLLENACNHLPSLVLVSSQYGEDFHSGSPGIPLSANGTVGNPVKQLQIGIHKSNLSRTVLILYPELFDTCGTTVQNAKNITLLGTSIQSKRSILSCKTAGQRALTLLGQSVVTISRITIVHGGIHVLQKSRLSMYSISIELCAQEHLYGGGLHVNDSHVSIHNVTFRQNYASHGGGISATNESTISMCNVFVSKNSAVWSGGGVYLDDSTIYSPLDCKRGVINENSALYGGGMYAKNKFSVKNILISQNKATGKVGGGGLFAVNASFSSISMVSFFGNEAREGLGGGGYVERTRLSIHHCNFSSNVCGGGGGGLYITKTSHLEMNNSSILSCNAPQGGGILASGNSFLDVLSCRFVGNSATTDGGAITSLDTSSVRLQDTVFKANRAQNGGCIAMKYGIGSLQNATASSGTLSASWLKCFENHASFTNDGFGGCIYLQGVRGSISESKFLFNKAGSGGTFYSSESSMKFQNLDIKGSESELYGGVLYAGGEWSDIKIANSSVYNSSSIRGEGGAFYARGPFTSLMVLNSNVNDVWASKGGAIACSKLSGCIFNAVDVAHASSRTGNGGAVLVHTGAKFQGLLITFKHCSSAGKGTLYAETGSHIDLKHFVFEHVEAHAGGGALGIDGVDSEFVLLRGIINFTSVEYGVGGAIHASNGVRGQMTTVGIFGCDSNIGGAIYLENSVVQHSNCTFSANKGVKGGTLYLSKTSSMLLHDSGIASYAQSNVAVHEGGFVYCASGANCQLSGFRVSDMVAYRGGSIFLNKNASLNVFATNIRRSVASVTCGGAAHVSENSALIFESVIVTQCGASTYAGAVSVFKDARFKMKNSAIEQCNASAVVSIEAELRFENSTFFDNTASTLSNRGGGACYAVGSRLSIALSLFKNNKAPYGRGGSILLISKSFLDMSSTTITDASTSAVYGGSIYSLESIVHMKQSIIDGTSASSSGGAVFISGGELSFTKCNVHHCTAEQGGGIYANDGAVVTLQENSTFDRNLAIYDGGAIYIEKATLLSKDVVYELNEALAFGAGVFVDRRAYAVTNHSTFRQNYAWSGGGIAMSRESDGVFEHSLFEKNTARLGAAIYCSHNKKTVYVRHTVIRQNDATQGAAVLLEFSHLSFNQTTIQKNHADQVGGGVALFGKSSLNAILSTFINNSATTGGGIYADGTSTVQITDSKFSGNAARNDGGAVALNSFVNALCVKVVFYGNVATDGDGGAVVRKQGARVHILDSQFVNNAATRGRGGGIFIGTRGCRLYEICDRAGVDRQNLEHCASGKELDNVDVTSISKCATLNQINFVENTAFVGGAGFYLKDWQYNVNADFNRIVGEVCSACIFSSNRMSDCVSHKAGDLMVSPISCKNDFATDVVDIELGWWPELSIQSGKPITSSLQIPPYMNFADMHSHIFFRSIDSFGGLARGDDRTSCTVERYCNSQKGETLMNGQCIDSHSGVAFSRKDNREVLLDKNTQQSSKGLILLKELRVRSTPQPDVPYKLSIACSIKAHDGIVLKSVKLIKIIYVGPCEPGTSLSGSKICEFCPINTYSNDGKGCTSCPTGGGCVRNVNTAGVIVPVGQTVPHVLPGFWKGPSPKDWSAQECNKNIMDAWSENICPAGEAIHSSKGPCTTINWHPDRTHRCRTSNQIYACPGKSWACRGSSNSTGEQCHEGYEGPLCAICSQFYHRGSEYRCVRCTGDDAQVSFLLYIVSFVAFAFISMLALHLYLREGGFRMKELIFRARHSVCLNKSYLLCCYTIPVFFKCKKRDLPEYKRALQEYDRALLHRATKRGQMKQLHKKKGTTGAALNMKREMNAVIDDETVWFRTEKFKIILSFLQVFSEYRRTYKIKWPDLVQSYMSFFSGLVDFDIFQLTSFDCILEYNYFDKFVMLTCLPLIAFVILAIAFIIGRIVFRRRIFESLRLNSVGNPQQLMSWPPSGALLESSTPNEGKEKVLKREASRSLKRGRSALIAPSKLPKVNIGWTGKIRKRVQDIVHQFNVAMHLEHSSQILSQHPMTKSQRELGILPVKILQKNLERWKMRVSLQMRFTFFFNKCVRVLFWVLLLAYVPVSTTILRLYLCEPVGSELYLVVDFRVRCSGAEYERYYVQGIFAGIFYILGIPLLFYATLHSARNENISFLLDVISKNENIRSKWLAMAKADVEVIGNLWVSPVTRSDELAAITQYMQRRNLRSHKTKSRIGFISESYSEHAWWFEIWELFRKLLMTGVIALIRPGSVVQIVIGLAIGVLSSYASLSIRPYALPSDGKLANLCLFQLFVVLFIGLLLKMDVDLFWQEGAGDKNNDSIEPISWIVITTHGMLMVFSFGLMFKEVKNAPRYQAAVRSSEQRRRELTRKQLETWAKGRRLALLRQARRAKEGQTMRDENGEEQHALLQLETEQIAREEEVRDEYKDITKDLMDIQTLQADDSITQEFLEDEKERLLKKKKMLETQLKSIMDEHIQESDRLEVYIADKKNAAKQRLKARIDRRRLSTASVGGGKVRPAQIVPRAGKQVETRQASPGPNKISLNMKSPIKRTPKRDALSSAKLSRGASDLHKFMHSVDMAVSQYEDKVELLFQLLPYYKLGNTKTDALIEKELRETDFREASNDHDLHNTLLHTVVAHGNEEATSYLLSLGYDVNGINEKSATPLHYAAARGALNLCQILLKHGAHPFAVDKSGHIPSAYAKVRTHMDVFEYLQKETHAYPLPPSFTMPSSLDTVTGQQSLKGNSAKSVTMSPSGSTFAKKEVLMMKWKNAAWKAGLKSLHKRGIQVQKWQSTSALAQAKRELEFEISQRENVASKSSKDASELALLKQKIAVLGEELETTKKYANQSAELSSAKVALEKEVIKLRRERSATGHDLEKESALRKKLHNTLEDMKGKIRVFCRMRPLSSSELARGCVSVCDFSPNGTAVKIGDPNQPKRAPKTYEFDSVYSPSNSQEDVFEDVSHLIQSTVDGYNVCIFAYGQTGSGKTFTMSGNNMYPGILPRAVMSLFQELKINGHKFEYSVTFSMAEIYLDEILDLLRSDSKEKAILKIKKDSKGRVFVDGITTRSPTTSEEVMALIDSGMRNRHVSATAMNNESSRSHLITTLTIEGVNRKTKSASIGKLTLVDLAGSESQQKTGASGNTLKEANAINTSLSALGNVISALTTGAKFIPYRGNKLTEILQDGLGGTAKTLMFVNASPADYNMQETMGSFEFALRCKQITNAKASAIVETQEIRTLKQKLKEMEEQIRESGGGVDVTTL